MQLTFEQIKAFTSGAVEVIKEGEFTRFRRFTENQIQAFEGVKKIFRERAENTTGCCIDFHTNSRAMRLAMHTPGKVEILINNLPTYFYKNKGPSKMCINLPEGECRVTVLLACHSDSVLTNIVLDEDAWVKPHTYARKILFLGDSITQGWQSERDSTSYAWLLSRYLDADRLNWGVGGSVFHADTLEDVGFDPDMVFIAYGTNDSGYFSSLDNLRNACRKYLERVKALHGDKPVFCITPIWRADDQLVKKTGTLEDVRKCINEECEKVGFVPIDGYELVPHCVDYYADGYLHPNDLGFCEYAANLLMKIQKYL